VGLGHLKAIIKAKEEIVQIVGTLARADNPWSREIRVSLVKEEQLDLSIHLIASISDRHRHIDFIRLYLDIIKDTAYLISYSTDKFIRDGKVVAKL
jgi:hypothetical protein